MPEEAKDSADLFYSTDELQLFAQLAARYTPEGIMDFQTRWQGVIDDIEANLEADPGSEVAQELVHRWNALLDEVYGDAPLLRQKIATAYLQGQIPAEQRPFSSEVMHFIAEALREQKAR